MCSFYISMVANIRYVHIFIDYCLERIIEDFIYGSCFDKHLI